MAGKQEPGSGGEHLDPGWLFRAYGEEIRRSGDVPDHTGERITHSPVGHARLFCVARPRLREQQYCCRTGLLISDFRSLPSRG